MAFKRFCLPALLGIFLCIGSGQSMPGNSRIWGGNDVATGQQVHVASIRINGAHTCSGSIISNKHILTAGHCVSALLSTSIDPATVTVRVASHNVYAGGELIGAEAIVIHPSYGNFLHDMAVITLKKSLSLSDKVQKIPLASEEDIYDEGTAVSVTGWGLQKSGNVSYKLQQLSMSILGAPNCELEAGYGYDSVLCLQHPVDTGICRGDDGAGVVSGSKLVGVASFAFGSCGTKFPDVASKVSYYNKWINSVIA